MKRHRHGLHAGTLVPTALGLALLTVTGPSLGLEARRVSEWSQPENLGADVHTAADGPTVASERVDAFVVLVERLNCQVDPVDHEPIHTAGFAEPSTSTLRTLTLTVGIRYLVTLPVAGAGTPQVPAPALPRRPASGHPRHRDLHLRSGTKPPPR